MALFTSKADKSLPLLTRLYQLDINNKRELWRFIISEPLAHGVAGTNYTLAMSAIGASTEEWEQANVIATKYKHGDKLSKSESEVWFKSLSLSNEHPHRIAQQLADIITLTRSVMDDLHRYNGFRAADAGKIVEWLNKAGWHFSYRKPDATWTDEEKSRWKELDITPVQHIGFRTNEDYTTGLTRLEIEVAREIQSLLGRAAEGLPAVHRCEVCQNLFVTTRKHSEVCSSRCHSRKSKRKNRQ